MGERRVYRELGGRELTDQVAGGRLVKTLTSTIRASESGGGLRRVHGGVRDDDAPGRVEAAIAWAPVTDWKLYDTIYTERYMRTPTENPDGYVRSAPLSKAKDLAAPLLLIHGGADDNVHLQNTIAFVDALTAAGKPYELQIQPRQKHGFRGAESVNSRNRGYSPVL